MRFCWILAVFSIFISAANAITCYDCNSLSDPRCNQYFYAEGVQQTNCDEAEMPEYLKKFERRIEAKGCITKIYDGINYNRFYIRRGCFFGFVDATDEACQAQDPYVPWAQLLDCQVCTEDLCNTNSGRKSVLSKIILFFAILCSFGIFKVF